MLRVAISVAGGVLSLKEGANIVISFETQKRFLAVFSPMCRLSAALR
jgi:hypothetical protein